MQHEEEIAQRTSPVSSLRAILDSYPLSVSLFRELLQNSDDAGASTQIFVLDRRDHSTETLYQHGLAKMQGPSLLAFNNALMRKEDWGALSSMHDSSKTGDGSKIGKYGVGFRSVFNLTDSPQILSDAYLAIFDPLRLYLDSEGKKVDARHISTTYPNQLSSFDFFLGDPVTTPFEGTVIRCPLRKVPSRISDQVVSSETILKLFKEFIDREISVALLFLQNIKRVEIHEVNSGGKSSLLAELTISRSDPRPIEDHSTIITATVELKKHKMSVTQTSEWQIVQSNFPLEEAVRIFCNQPGFDPEVVEKTLQYSKYFPEVKIAVDTTVSTSGRLFTYLPLPIFSGFPVHIHGLFAIDSSRTHLKRPGDIGLQPESRDYTKVRWNYILFETFLPRTWSYLIADIVSRRLLSNAFSIWPPEKCHQDVHSYYASLPQKLLGFLLDAKADVWPVYHVQNAPSEFRNLESLVVVSPTDPENLVRALATMGLSLTQPPRYVFELIKKSSRNGSVLSPELAHNLLLEHVEEIRQASEKDQDAVLEYLLSTKNVLNVCGLPLIPLANKEKVALSQKDNKSSYTILTRTEFDVFGACDDLSIPLHRLPFIVADTFSNLGPSSLNVKLLQTPRIIEYLSQYPNRLGKLLSEGKKDPNAVRWLSKYWAWMDTYKDKDNLFRQTRNLFLLPSTYGLKKADQTIFQLRRQPPAYTQAYRALGLPFLDVDFSDPAEGVLAKRGLAKSIKDIPVLLDSLPSTPPKQLTSHVCENILKHLGNRLEESHGRERIERLKRLPIFPILNYTNVIGQPSTLVENWGSIPNGHSIRSVAKPSLVPVLDNVSFIRLDNIAAGIVKHLSPDHPRALSDEDLVALAVSHMSTQPGHLQRTILQYIIQHQTRMPPLIFDNLRSHAFVLAEDGEYRRPGEIVDPDSEIASLYLGSQAHYPLRSTAFQTEMVSKLKSLGLMKATITPKIMEERIDFISSDNLSEESRKLARNLLKLFASHHIDFSRVLGIAQAKWLPTNRGLCNAEECRHQALLPLQLFDRVLAVLESFVIPSALQRVLGWDQPLSLEVLIKQLDHVISERNYEAAVEIIKEFVRRQWTDDQLAELEKVTKDRPWIPTTDGILADTTSSVFRYSPLMVNSGFHQVKTDLKANDFFKRVGCNDSPSTKAIIDKLHSLVEGSASVEIVDTSVSLLRSLRHSSISELERTKLLIPDTESRLRPFSKVFFNDIADNSVLVDTEGHFIAHCSIDEKLAKNLKLDRLGLRYADLRDLGPNMGQAPITTVMSTLQQYTDKQFLLEFLANAEDAKATLFTVVLNHRTVRDRQTRRVLSPAMEYLCHLPSLVVYNNARFTKSDFEGICKTSIGGKQGRPDTIGEFGQGVLTMYHFTDLAIIVSGGHVVFMDPAKRHLPLSDYASLSLTLRHVQQFYKDHLSCVDGLFGFDMSKDFYDGTLFILPLRGSAGDNTTGSSPEPIVQNVWGPKRITSEILEPFGKSVTNCLLFTNMTNISCATGAQDGRMTFNWSFQADRNEFENPEVAYCLKNVEITDSNSSTTTWKTVTTSRPKEDLPPALHVPSLLRRDPFAGLAVPVDNAKADGPSFNFFSSLPLSTPTSIPMHVMASFKLASDRRQIRLDTYEKLPSEYNTWLLETVIPPLYLFLLEHLLISGDEHYSHRWPTVKDDTLSQHIANSFYNTHLKTSDRRLFPSRHASDHLLTPQTAVMTVREPEKRIRHALALLAPPRLVDLPAKIQDLADRAGIQKVSQSFVKDEILRKPTAITSDIDFDLIGGVIQYLTHDWKSSNHLCGLPILPLEDGSFGTFEARGSSPSYYIWSPNDQQQRHNFPQDRFVHPNLSVKKDLTKMDVNVEELDPTSIKSLIEAKLSTFSTTGGISAAQVTWINDFWDSWSEYKLLGLSAMNISSYPLVVTNQTSEPLVNLDKCKLGDVFLVRGDSPDDRAIHTTLQALGLHVVRVDGQLPESLQKILKGADFPELGFARVLTALEDFELPLTELIESLDDEIRNCFARWARENIPAMSKRLVPTAAELPIWESAGSRDPRALRCANDVELLPEGLSVGDAADFLAICVADDPSLKHLEKYPMTFQNLAEQLNLPDVLNVEIVDAYKLFFAKWLPHISTSYKQIPVPTAAYTVQNSDQLYERGTMFEVVFPPDSEYFVHPEFAEFEVRLRLHGLRRERDMDIEMFKECAQALDVDDQMVLIPAREVFRVYSEALPLAISSEQRHLWHTLNDLSFIPRRNETVRRLHEHEPGLDIPQVVTELPLVVNPEEVVRREYEAIAWSQRASFEQQPDIRVLNENPELGKPNSSEVLEHLRYLSRLSAMRPSEREILFHDLQAVYKYFNDNINTLPEDEVLANHMFSLRDEPLFLNIDHPHERLNWINANSLAFDCNDGEGPIQDVRQFLRPYGKLLEAAGAYRVRHPTFVGHEDPKSESAKLGKIRAGFEQLRKEKALTDVVFIAPNDGEHKTEQLYAHRSFLAGFSGYFKSYFCGDFSESQENASVSNPITVDLSGKHSWKCVQAVIDYIYTGSGSEEDLPLETLLEILCLSSYWHVLDLFENVQGEIVRRRLINPDTVDEIKEVAEREKAQGLLTACREYENENKDFIQKMRLIE